MKNNLAFDFYDNNDEDFNEDYIEALDEDSLLDEDFNLGDESEEYYEDDDEDSYEEDDDEEDDDEEDDDPWYYYDPEDLESFCEYCYNL